MLAIPDQFYKLGMLWQTQVRFLPHGFMKYDVCFDVCVSVETEKPLNIHDEAEEDKVIQLAIEKAQKMAQELFLPENVVTVFEVK